MTSTVDPAAAAQQTIILIDPRWEPPGVPSCSYAEMSRTCSEIEALDLSVDHKREKAHRYLGWMQAVAESTYGVPAETLRDVNRGTEFPAWPGYKVDESGWYQRPLRDGEPRRSHFPMGFSDDVSVFVLSPAQDPSRAPPHDAVETHFEMGVMTIALESHGIEIAADPLGVASLLSRAAGGRPIGDEELGQILRAVTGGGLDQRAGQRREPASQETRNEVTSTIAAVLEGAPSGLREGILEIVNRALNGEELGPADVGELVHRAIERDGNSPSNLMASMAAMARLQATVAEGTGHHDLVRDLIGRMD